MKKIYPLLLVAFIANPVLALTPFYESVNHYTPGAVTLNTGELDFSDRVVNTQNQISAWIYNGSNDSLTITDIWSPDAAFSAVFPWVSVIAPEDSAQITLVFTPYTNIAFASVVFIETVEANQTIPVSVTGNGWLLPLAYQPTFNLYDEELEAVLDDIFPDQVDLGYNGARMVMYDDLDNFNDSLECVYTGFRQYHEAGSGSTFPDPINCEHTWPQSMFDSQAPMRGDIHHLFPAHGTANTARSNYPFGDVVSNIEWEWGGSVRGWNEYNQRVFDPRDVHKGDAARAMFYFLTRYGNLGNFMTNFQEQDLRGWYFEDPVSQKEIDRNNGIYSYQQNRNPFVDHPYFLHRIKNFLGYVNRPDTSIMVASPSQRSWTHNGSQSVDTLRVVLTNTGRVAYTASNFQLSSTTMNLLNYAPLTVEPGETRTIPIRVTYSQNSDQATLEFGSNATVGGSQSILLSYSLGPVSVDETPIIAASPQLMSAYPNPFNGGTVLKMNLQPEGGFLRIYNVQGQELESMAVPAGAGTADIRWNPRQLAGGIYLAQLQQGNRFTTLKLMLLN